MKPCNRCEEQPELKVSFCYHPHMSTHILYQYKHSCYKDGKRVNVYTYKCTTLEQAAKDWNT